MKSFVLLIVILLLACSQITSKENKFEKKVLEQEEVLKRQELEKQRQERELEDLRRQQYYNDYMNRFESQTNN